VSVEMGAGATSLVDQCYEELRGLIIRCEIAPGSRLNEKKLIAQLGFGRTPVREALLRLTQDRLVETRQRSGYIVRPLTRKAVTDILTVWREVVQLIVSLGLPHFSAEDRAAWKRILGDKGAGGIDAFEAGRRSIAFFDELVDRADSEPLGFMYHHLSANLERITLALAAIPHSRDWVDTRGVVLELLDNPDPEAAGAKARDRVTESNAALLQFLDDHGAFGSEDALMAAPLRPGG
jgi:DNA-binding GntR family transcriptional regulator